MKVTVDAIRQVEAYGKTVWADVEMDELRRERCLCLNCLWYDECAVAIALYAICRQFGVALAVTRCEDWCQGHDGAATDGVSTGGSR